MVTIAFNKDSASPHKAKRVQDWCKDNFNDFITSDESSSSPNFNVGIRLLHMGLNICCLNRQTKCKDINSDTGSNLL